MKYVMLQTAHGQKLPILFPDALNHIDMATVAKVVIEQQLKSAVVVVSAGFVNVGNDVEVHGESESLGGLASNPSDAARIMLGESVAFMPDEMLAPLLDKLKGRKG